MKKNEEYLPKSELRKLKFPRDPYTKKIEDIIESVSKFKVYVVIFTCATTRSVHLEVIQRMDTESLYLALTRFFRNEKSAQKIRLRQRIQLHWIFK